MASYPRLLLYVLIMGLLGGLLVGLSVKFFGATGGLADAIAELHHEGRLSYRSLPGMGVFFKSPSAPHCLFWKSPIAAVLSFMRQSFQP
ncbi:MAG TPA: hypothetical protein IGP82_11940 [Thermosynechococcus sp. M55_K2018_012]|nr:hypothetical protein [Thermosynechococcus sp. M55_K2018_012]